MAGTGLREASLTRPLPFTQASLRRAIEAVRKIGLRVKGIRPDGAIIVRELTETVAEPSTEAFPDRVWLKDDLDHSMLLEELARARGIAEDI